MPAEREPTNRSRGDKLSRGARGRLAIERGGRRKNPAYSLYFSEGNKSKRQWSAQYTSKSERAHSLHSPWRKLIYRRARARAAIRDNERGRELALLEFPRDAFFALDDNFFPSRKIKASRKRQAGWFADLRRPLLFLCFSVTAPIWRGKISHFLLYAPLVYTLHHRMFGNIPVCPSARTLALW